jgi:hypothetical protein
LDFLQKHILSDAAFQFPPQLLRRLGADRWSHWGNERAAMGRVEYPVHDRVLAVQKTVLDHLFDPQVLERVQNNGLMADKDDKPLTIAEIFRSVTDGVWADAAADGKDGKKSLLSSVMRRNLQREHLKDLTALALGRESGAPPDARSLARMHLKEIAKHIEKTLGDKGMAVDETTRAHLEECQEGIAKVLNASLQATEP